MRPKLAISFLCGYAVLGTACRQPAMHDMIRHTPRHCYYMYKIRSGRELYRNSKTHILARKNTYPHMHYTHTHRFNDLKKLKTAYRRIHFKTH